MFRKSFAASFAACALLLTLAHSQAEAQTIPFKITGTGVGPNGVPLPGAPSLPHTAVGNATHLGNYQGEGRVQTDPIFDVLPDGSITGTFGSALDPLAPFVFTAANGDNLACVYGRTDYGADNPGTYTLVPQGDGTYVAYWIAKFVPYAPLCTGRFAGVTGGWIMYAQSDPFVLGSPDPATYSWFGQGTLTFSK